MFSWSAVDVAELGRYNGATQHAGPRVDAVRPSDPQARAGHEATADATARGATPPNARRRGICIGARGIPANFQNPSTSYSTPKENGAMFPAVPTSLLVEGRDESAQLERWRFERFSAIGCDAERIGATSPGTTWPTCSTTAGRFRDAVRVLV